jgi:hypothetical protein
MHVHGRKSGGTISVRYSFAKLLSYWSRADDSVNWGYGEKFDALSRLSSRVLINMPPKYNLGNFIFLMSIPGNFAAIFLVFFMTSLISSLHHLLSFFQLGFQRFPRINVPRFVDLFWHQFETRSKNQSMGYQYQVPQSISSWSVCW